MNLRSFRGTAIKVARAVTPVSASTLLLPYATTSAQPGTYVNGKQLKVDAVSVSDWKEFNLEKEDPRVKKLVDILSTEYTESHKTGSLAKGSTTKYVYYDVADNNMTIDGVVYGNEFK